MRKLQYRRNFHVFLCILFGACSFCHAQFSIKLDSLDMVTAYYSPLRNPRAFEFDGTYFWVANLSEPVFYKLDINANKVDTLVVPFNRIVGITFHDGEMWVARDTVIGTSPVISTNGDTLYYENNYCVYRISPDNGTVLDSIRFADGSGGLKDHIWGIAYHKNNIYVSYNGGWGPCTYKLYPDNKDSLDKLMSAHPSGMTVIGDERWGIAVGTTCDGNLLSILSETGSDSVIYITPVSVADITFDGEHIWLCDRKNSSLCKMVKITASAQVQPVCQPYGLTVYKSNKIISVFPPAPAADFNFSVYTLHGRKCSPVIYRDGNRLQWHVKSVANGWYILQCTNGSKQYRKQLYIAQ